MDRLRALIGDYSGDYPHFEELFELIRVSQQPESTPDTILDCGKSIIEAISKNILSELDSEIDARRCRKLAPEKAFRRAIKALAHVDSGFEHGYSDSLESIISEMKTLRNDRGEISHGHLAPKERSTAHFAKLVLGFSEELCLYMLRCFFELEPEINYDNYTELNDQLDETGQQIGPIAYSKLLYMHDFPAYEAAVDEYNARSLDD